MRMRGSEGAKGVGSAAGRCCRAGRVSVFAFVLVLAGGASVSVAAEDKPAAGYDLVLGGFGGVLTAEALREELARQDHAARVQRRVAVGPYEARERAEAVRVHLRQAHGLQGIVVPQAVAGGFLVQVGVFLQPDNAEGLRRRLMTADLPVQVHGRVVLGPYAGRGQAQAVLARLRDERAVDGLLLARHAAVSMR